MAAGDARTGSGSRIQDLREPRAVLVWRRMPEIHADLVVDLEGRFQARHGLTASEFDVLINITPGEPIRQRDLVARVVLTRSAMSRLLARLTRRRLVTRASADDDRRGVRVQLTDAGVQLRCRAARTNTATVQEYFGDMDVDELRSLDSLLRLLQQSSAGEQTDPPGEVRDV